MKRVLLTIQLSDMSRYESVLSLTANIWFTTLLIKIASIKSACRVSRPNPPTADDHSSRVQTVRLPVRCASHV